MSKDAVNSPTVLSDDELENVDAGFFGKGSMAERLKADGIVFKYDEDGQIAAKIYHAKGSGSGSAAGGGAPADGRYTFDEVIDGEYVKASVVLR